MRVGAFITSAVAAAAIAAVCSGCGSSTVAPGSLVRAADVTAQTGGAHMQLSAQVEAAALPGAVTLTGGGYFNYPRREGKISISLAGVPSVPGLGSAPSIEEIFKGSDVYVKSSLLAARLPGSAQWVKIDVARVAGAAGLDPTQILGGQANPAQLLEYLKADSGTVTKVGEERVRGVPTTHYRGTIDLGKVAGALAGAHRGSIQGALAQLGVSGIPVDVWTDGHDLVRRLEITLHAPAAGQNLKVRFQLELFGFGATPTVSAPAPSETLDATSQALSGLGSLGA